MDDRAALDIEKIRAELEATRAGIEKTRAEVDEAIARTRKILTENRWYPAVGTAALIGAVIALTKLFL